MTEVVVVGAGPSGMALALDLAQRGTDVRLLEARTEPSPHSKALGVWPRTIDILGHLVPEATFDGELSPQSAMRYYSEGTPLGDIDMTDRRHGGVVLPQPSVEAALRRGLDAAGVPIEWGTRVVGLNQDAGGVTLEVQTDHGPGQVRASWVVGADGASSATRAAVGARFEGDQHPLSFLVADVDSDHPFDRTVTHYFTSSRGILVMSDLPGGRTRLFTAMPPGVTGTPDVDQAVAHCNSLVPSDLRVGDTHWLSTFRVSFRESDRLREGRVLLIGDAAHVHSPAGGQGLNAGVADAFSLGWRLARVVTGALPDSALDEHCDERARATASVVKQARVQTRLWLVSGRRAVIARNLVLRAALRSGLLSRTYLPWLSGQQARVPVAEGSGRRRVGPFRVGRLVPDLPLVRPASAPEAGRGTTALGERPAYPLSLRTAVLGRQVGLLVAPRGVDAESLDRWVRWCAADDPTTEVAVLTDGLLTWGASGAPRVSGRSGSGVEGVLIRPDGHVRYVTRGGIPEAPARASDGAAEGQLEPTAVSA